MPLLTAPGISVHCEAIIFDKDGTLTDQRLAISALGRERNRAMQEVAGERAAGLWREIVGFDPGTMRIDPGGPLATAPAREEMILAAGAIYRAGQPWLLASTLATRAYALVDERLQPPYGAELLDGVFAALARLRDVGFRMAIATTDRRRRTLDITHALRLKPFIDAIVCVDDVVRGKPAPDMALEICRQLDVEPYQVVVVGDTELDMRMGRAVGAAACIGVKSGMNEGADLEGLAHVILDSVAQLSAV